MWVVEHQFYHRARTFLALDAMSCVHAAVARSTSIAMARWCRADKS
jgi:uncharacterized damage-inducible protein DinB